MIRVLLLEPDAWRYRGMWSVMRESGEIDVIGELDYGKVLTMQRGPDTPDADVVVIAHRLILEYGLAIVPVLRDLFDPCAVLVHGEIDSLEVAAQLYAAGARGYFTLSTPPGQLPRAVRILSLGKYWGPREAIALLAEQLLQQRPSAEPEAAIEDQDQQLLDLLNEGLSNKEIGQRLGLAEPTIKGRFNRLYKRFGVATRLQLLSAAMSRGLVQPRS